MGARHQANAKPTVFGVATSGFCRVRVTEKEIKAAMTLSISSLKPLVVVTNEKSTAAYSPEETLQGKPAGLLGAPRTS